MIVSKYCASGNDFIIFHAFTHENRSNIAIELCNRFYGIGADGLVVLVPFIQKPETLDCKHNIAYQWEFYNSDGSVANMCGNASRAVSFYAYYNNLAPLKHAFLSQAGIIKTHIREILSPKQAFIQSNIGTYSVDGNFIEECHGNVYEFELITMSIPHLVCKAESARDFQTLSANLEFLSRLRHKYNANVSIAFKGNENTIHYATFERGVEGITQACGTGACAVYVSYRDFNQEYILIPPSKEKLKVSSQNNEIYFSGLVNKVCDCVIDL